MRTTRMAWLGLGLILLVAIHASAEPEPEPEPTAKDLPADVEAKAVIDPAKMAANAALLASDARNRKSSQNLMRIGVAVHYYAGTENETWPANIADKAGKQLLSWRVRILPHVKGQKALYEKFKQDEPWDSKHNLALLEKMPEVFESPRVTVKRKGYTVYQVFSGPGALYESGKTKYKVSNLPDGTANTVFAVESSKAVPWTKPADIPYDKAKPIPDFGKAYGGKPLCLMCDGTPRVIDLKKISTATLRNVICPDDGQVLPLDW